MPQNRLAVENHPANQALLKFLAQQAEPRQGKAWHIVDGYELHTHPDIEERLHEAASPLEDVVRGHVYGVSVLIHPSGVIIAAAPGMSSLLLRLPEAPGHGGIFEPLGPPWYMLDAWASHIPGGEWLAELQRYGRRAYEGGSAL